MAENNITADASMAEEAQKLSDGCQTVVWFADSKNVLAVMAIADKIKETSKKAIRQLQAAGIEVHILTGDNDSTARQIATETGVNDYKALILLG